MINQPLRSKTNILNLYTLRAFLAIGILLTLSTIYFILDDSNFLLPIIFGPSIILYCGFFLYKNNYEAPDLVLTDSYIQIGNFKYNYDQIIKFDFFNDLKIEFNHNYIKNNFKGEYGKIYDFTFEDRLYSNLHEVKLFLEQVALNHKPYCPIENKILKKLPDEIKFTSNFRTIQFLSIIFQIISFIILVLVVIYLERLIRNVKFFDVFIFSILPILILYHIYKSLFYSIKIAGNYLIVYSPLFFWNKSIYKLEDIRHIESVLITVGKLHLNGIKIYTKDYRFIVYNINYMSKSRLNKLIKKLELIGIPNRDIFSIFK